MIAWNEKTPEPEFVPDILLLTESVYQKLRSHCESQVDHNPREIGPYLSIAGLPFETHPTEEQCRIRAIELWIESKKRSQIYA